MPPSLSSRYRPAGPARGPRIARRRRVALALAVIAATVGFSMPIDSRPAEAVDRNLKVAVVLYNFADFDSQPLSTDAVDEMMFDRSARPSPDTGSVAAYFDEISEGQLRFSGHLDHRGDVFGWYTLDRSIERDGRPYVCPSLEEDATYPDGIYPEIEARAAADGFDKANYDIIVYASNFDRCAVYNGGARLALVSAADRSDWTVWAHEIGHILGLRTHARRAACEENGQTVPWGGRCQMSEYGDPYSVMGGDSLHGHFSIAEKLRLGWWRAGADVADVRASGRYRIAPVTARPGGFRGLRIHTTTNPNADDGPGRVYGQTHLVDLSYYVEFRTPTGYNRVSQERFGEPQAVTVRVGLGGNHDPWTSLVDLDPSSQAVGLAPGEWFHDRQSRVSLRVVPGSMSSAGVEIDVRIDDHFDIDRDGRAAVAFHLPTGWWATTPTLDADGTAGWDDTNRSAPDWANLPRTVPVAGDFDGDGIGDIAYHRPTRNWSAGWDMVPVLFGNGDGSWTPTEGTSPRSVHRPEGVAIAGHFDNDNRTDLAFVYPGTRNRTIDVLLSRGDGRWAHRQASTPDWANQPGVIPIAGQFDSDGLTDIAFHRPGSTWSTVPVLLSRGDGTFAATNHRAPSWANQPGVVAIPGQFNNDGLTDIAFHRPGSTWNTVPVLYARGAGAWRSTNLSAPPWANARNAVAIAGNFDDDLLTDIAFHRPNGGNRLPVLLANGNGSWRDVNRTVHPWVNEPEAVAFAGHFNRDARTDIAVHFPGGRQDMVMVAAQGDGSWAGIGHRVPGWASYNGVRFIN